MGLVEYLPRPTPYEMWETNAGVKGRAPHLRGLKQLLVQTSRKRASESHSDGISTSCSGTWLGIKSVTADSLWARGTEYAALWLRGELDLFRLGAWGASKRHRDSYVLPPISLAFRYPNHCSVGDTPPHGVWVFPQRQRLPSPAIQRKCAGNKSDNVVFKSISSRHPIMKLETRT